MGNKINVKPVDKHLDEEIDQDLSFKMPVSFVKTSIQPSKSQTTQPKFSFNF